MYVTMEKINPAIRAVFDLSFGVEKGKKIAAKAAV
jgi:hypothetical protein